jgi:hypothetical protein
MTHATLRSPVNTSPLQSRFRIFTGTVTFQKSVDAPNARSITYGRVAGTQNVNDSISGVQVVNFATTITWGDNRDSVLPLANDMTITGTAAASRFFIAWVE